MQDDVIPKSYQIVESCMPSKTRLYGRMQGICNTGLQGRTQNKVLWMPLHSKGPDGCMNCMHTCHKECTATRQQVFHKHNSLFQHDSYSQLERNDAKGNHF